jgi:hypothetical protein
MNVEIGAEAAQFPEKEYINGIAFAEQYKLFRPTPPISSSKAGQDTGQDKPSRLRPLWLGVNTQLITPCRTCTWHPQRSKNDGGTARPGLGTADFLENLHKSVISCTR